MENISILSSTGENHPEAETINSTDKWITQFMQDRDILFRKNITNSITSNRKMKTLMESKINLQVLWTIILPSYWHSCKKPVKKKELHRNIIKVLWGKIE